LNSRGHRESGGYHGRHFIYHTDQGKFFGYASTLLGDGSRLSTIGDASDGPIGSLRQPVKILAAP
jgi:hypothetical protein